MSLSPTINPNINKAHEEEIAKIPLSEKGKRIKAKHPDWDNEICNTVASKLVQKGMTAEQAIAAWGKPHKINKTIYGSSTHEQWVMHSMGSDYLYFEDGILTTIQTSN